VKGLLAGTAGLVLVVVAGAGGVMTGALPGLAGGGEQTPLPSAASSVDLTTAAVERTTIETSADLDGSLSYEPSRAVTAGSAGMVTRLPAEGSVIERGEVLYELNGRVRPRLLHGDRPMWRRLGPEVSDGADVLQLEQNLRAMGFAPKGMRIDRHWDTKTTTAVKRWQKAVGRKRDGTLDGTDLAFLPGAVRVAAHSVEVGESVAPGAPVLGATTATRIVTLDLSASRQDLVTPGQAVSIELPDESVVPGHVRSVGRIATPGENGGPTSVPVTIDIATQATLPDLDAAPVTVHVVTESHPNVLAVPVNALVALLEGGYAVEVVGADGARRNVGVETGLFEDGKVEISGDGLAAGDLVVVPR
jgi:peptidoglycan hydrolase-like protein with peptidoglycan-binding domain